MDSIRAISFDAGGTLLEPWPSVGHVYADVIRHRGVGTPEPGILNQRFAAAWKMRGRFDYSKPAWARLVAQTLEGLTPDAANPDLFEALWTRFIEPSAWRVFDDVRPTLQALHERGWRLVVVSNWDERLHPVLEATGLARHFEFILPSIEGPAPKPDPRLFAQAAERLGLESRRILHVGDSRAEDYSGAQAAGFHAVHLVRHGASVPPEEISSLAELLVRLPNP